MASLNRIVALVDDEVSIRRALERLIHAAGFEAMTFASGVSFLNAMPIAGLRCVVLDIHMPELNGIEVKAQLSRTWPELPVIFVTGQEDPEAQRRALATHPLVFLSKPIDTASLLKAIENLQ